MILSLDNVGIASADLERSVAFYEKLGFKKTIQKNGCLMIAGSAKLFIFAATNYDSAQRPRDLDLKDNPPGFDHISLLVDDVDRSYEEIRVRGLEFASPPADRIWGARAAMLRDPDGNNVNLLKWWG